MTERREYGNNGGGERRRKCGFLEEDISFGRIQIDEDAR